MKKRAMILNLVGFAIFMGILCCCALKVSATEMSLIDEKLVQNFAKLECPGLDEFPSAKKELSTVFAENGKIDMFWLGSMQKRIFELSNAKVVFDRDFFHDPLVFISGDHEHFIAFDLESNKQRRYIVIKGAMQISCEIVP